MTDSRSATPRPSSGHWHKLNQTLTQDGLSGVQDWAAAWLYWNSHAGRRAVENLGWQPRKYGIRNPIVVYQMGKVGSNSIYHALLKLGLDVPVYHAHYLNDLDEHEAVMQASFRNPDEGLKNLVPARAIREDMRQHPRKHWDFITLVRAPIPRMASVLFQNIENFFPNAAERYQRGELGLSEVTDYFAYKMSDKFMLEWFNRQLQVPFGIDVFRTPFNKKRGYQVYKHGRIRMLLLRLEDLNRVVTTAMHEFLRLPDFQLANYNVGESKDTGTLYRDFMKNLVLPQAMIDRWNSIPLAQHFYTPEELAQSVARWRR